jgi:hypothetical protein
MILSNASLSRKMGITPKMARQNLEKCCQYFTTQSHTMYSARYDSWNFSFEALGYSAADAKKALIKGLKKHAKQYNLDSKWYYPSDIYVVELDIDKPYRDRGEVK